MTSNELSQDPIHYLPSSDTVSQQQVTRDGYPLCSNAPYPPPPPFTSPPWCLIPQQSDSQRPGEPLFTTTFTAACADRSVSLDPGPGVGSSALPTFSDKHHRPRGLRLTERSRKADTPTTTLVADQSDQQPNHKIRPKVYRPPPPPPPSARTSQPHDCHNTTS